MKIILMPQQLYALAKKELDSGEPMCLSAEQVKASAEQWHRDQEKIKYLESLLLRKER